MLAYLGNFDIKSLSNSELLDKQKNISKMLYNNKFIKDDIYKTLYQLKDMIDEEINYRIENNQINYDDLDEEDWI